MKLTSSVLVTAFAAVSVVNAHFSITFPGVRGPFNEDNEPQFCDGYTAPANRTRFPLTNGFITWEASHGSWTIGVLLSTSTSPTSFGNFHTSSGGDQLVVGYFQGTGTSGCIRIMPTAAGISGIQNGSNVTLQMVFDGGDGRLYQCMDVTLDDQYRIPTDVRCANPQGQPPSNSSSSPSSTQSGSSSLVKTGTSGGTSSPTSTGSPSKGGAVVTAVNGLLGLGLAGVLAVILA
ncbi:hypothetical protein BDM02DRAFT_3123116 [Thelephora ganbajun]|uniref:Uncharacterized protein n=1 Tax=Thelephora ganbajun TaxID=370292 RepID=A0ACB6Z1R9_THEGA|nr:hypothetical protein BDM02DRAFT_3123116 [Thelephora ganbajun]